MQIINLDASDWADVQSFYSAIFNELDAPFWHGSNINALIDSIVWGGINGVEPPYTICVHNLQKASVDARDEFEALMSHIADQKAEHLRLHGYEPEVFLKAHP